MHGCRCSRSVFPCVAVPTRRRPCPGARPPGPPIGGRAGAAVPRPRRLCARRRGGSGGSTCSSLFFPRMLNQRITCRCAIGERWRGLQLCSVGMQVVAPLHDALLGEPKVPRVLRAGVPLAPPAHEQHPLHGRSVPAREDSTTGQGIQALARVAAPNGQATPAVHPQDAGRVASRPAGWAGSAWGVEVLREPRATLLVIQHVENWELHTLNHTKVALLVLLSQCIIKQGVRGSAITIGHHKAPTPGPQPFGGRVLHIGIG